MLPLATSTWGAEEYAAIDQVIRSDKFTMGPRVREFEEQFATAFGSRFAVMVNSGSSANLLAVAALFFTSPPRIAQGATVIVPAVSWATTYYPLAQYGLKLKFVDVDPRTLNLDLDKLEEALTPDVGAIFAVNLLGNPVNYTRLSEIVGGRDVLVLEDNCESMGASLQGRSTGTFGVIGTFSTYFSHHISTIEGGLCVTNDEELYHVLLSLRAHGWTRDLPWPNKLIAPDERGEFYDLFRFVIPGYNVRPLEFSGAIGSEQLKRLPVILAGRRRNAEVFTHFFSNSPLVHIQHETGQSSWFGFSLILQGSASGKRDEVVARLGKAGVETRPIVAGNFYRNPVLAHLSHVAAPALPTADWIDQDGFYIGNHHYDISQQLAVVRDVIEAVAGE